MCTSNRSFRCDYSDLWLLSVAKHALRKQWLRFFLCVRVRLLLLQYVMKLWSEIVSLLSVTCRAVDIEHAFTDTKTDWTLIMLLCDQHTRTCTVRVVCYVSCADLRVHVPHSPNCVLSMCALGPKPVSWTFIHSHYWFGQGGAVTSARVDLAVWCNKVTCARLCTVKTLIWQNRSVVFSVDSLS